MDIDEGVAEAAGPAGPPERELLCRLLRCLAADPAATVEVLGAELGLSAHAVEERLRLLHGWGLVLVGEEFEPVVLWPGEQFLEREGRVPLATLGFLAGPVDDLNAREALRRAGLILMREFGRALVEGRAVEHARELVPSAFSPAVDVALAVRLHAAASGLVARLSLGEPAACVAEEVLAVALIDIAAEQIELDANALGAAAAERAKSRLNGMFEVFQDDDVLSLFEMVEPGDAALAGHDLINRQLGVADQRIEAWFEPFSWAVPTGHLDEQPRPRWP